MPRRKPAVVDDPAASETPSAIESPSKTTPRKRTRATEDDVPLKNIVTAESPSKRRKTKIEEETANPKSPSPVTKQVNKEVVTESARPTKASKTKVKKEIKSETEIETIDFKVKKERKVKQEIKGIPGNDKVQAETTESKVKRKRKTKEEKEAEAMPLAPRTIGHKLFVGAHVSASGGVHNAVSNSVRIGGNAFALFLKSQRKWSNPALADEVATSFHSACNEHSYSATNHIVPHGSYLVNLAHQDTERTKQAYDSFLDDLQRCERLGIKLYNFHPGNTTGGDRASAIKHLASNLNRAHKATKSVVTLLENMAAAGGNIIGTTFQDLRDIIAHVEDKSRVGVCLDTCHAFAAGYDLRTPEAYQKTMQEFDDIVGMKYLRALHLNDSKAPLSARRDLHANIGTGFLGLRAFHNVANDSRLAGLPLVLETPITLTDEDGEPLKDEKSRDREDSGIWAREIKLIESLVDMDTSSAEFLELEKALARKGAKERKRIADQAERRVQKDAKKAAKGKKKASAKDESEESSLSELEEDEKV